MRFLILIIFSLVLGQATAQQGKHPSKSKAESHNYTPQELGKLAPLKQPIQRKALPNKSKVYPTLGKFQTPVFSEPNLTFVRDAKTDLPIFIKGTVGTKEKGNNLEERCHSFLNVIQAEMQIERAENEFLTERIETDELGMTHVRMQQYFQGIPVHGSMVILHEKNDQIRAFNGRYYPTPQLEQLAASIDAITAFDLAKADVQQHTTVAAIAANQQHLVSETTQELVIYHQNQDLEAEKLAWHISFHPNIREKWDYFMDAHTGEVLQGHRSSCSFACTHHIHAMTKDAAIETKAEPTEAELEANFMATIMGPVTASATDLLGINRTINVYEHQGTYFMIDASRSMFNSNASNFPDEPVGAIWTIDGNNTSPQSQNNFNTTHVTSNNNNWNSATAVSAHYNGGLAYEYFKNTFNRNSINGSGGNIVSIINVADDNGGSMDNAFWNGAAMFYGNGGQAFDPLAKALDVAGHEMSHGVIQKTANLEYIGQSGALNESFADVFGAMIDRNDWRMGEDVVNTSFFPSGALRDLANPNNGGNQLGDPGWQPKHMNEYENLPNTAQGDYGGVHINSGIPNRAFYLLASDIGKSNAESIYYRALTTYLTKSSQFVDCRNAVVQAASDLFGNSSNEVTAANNAFSSVGIGSGSGTTTQQDIEENPGDEFILHANANLTQLLISGTDGSNPQAISGTSMLSKPSITDDGSAVVFIGTDKKMHMVQINWSTGEVNQFELSASPIWRNVAISKGGERIAALTDDNVNEISVYDFALETWNDYPLYNPTFTEGVSTGDVQYADVIEWDFSGEHIIYDAFNEIQSSFGDDISYWDIGIMKVWDNGYDGWVPYDGNISKLFSGLPENTSVGNPTFSKNSDFIVAFDFIDENNNAQLFGVNIETGKTSDDPIFTNGVLNYPNYSTDDTSLIFDAQDSNGGQVLGVVNVTNDKINGQGDAALLINSAKWGTWFAVGERELVGTETIEAADWGLSVFPNPVAHTLHITADFIIEDDLIMTLTDITGTEVLKENFGQNQGLFSQSIDVKHLPAGSYILQLRSGSQLFAQKVAKF